MEECLIKNIDSLESYLRDNAHNSCGLDHIFDQARAYDMVNYPTIGDIQTQAVITTHEPSIVHRMKGKDQLTHYYLVVEINCKSTIWSWILK